MIWYDVYSMILIYVIMIYSLYSDILIYWYSIHDMILFIDIMYYINKYWYVYEMMMCGSIDDIWYLLIFLLTMKLW